jgi:hypothetical protein
MGAVASLKIEEAAVSAIAAGADMVITWPPYSMSMPPSSPR